MMYIEAQSKNPGGIEGFDTPLFFEAIAQAEAQEAQAIGEQTPVAKLVEAGNLLSGRIGCGCGPCECGECNNAYQAWVAALRS